MRNELVLITGGTGSGKSYLAKELIESVVASSEFLGSSVVIADLKMSKFTDKEQLPGNTQIVRSVDEAFDVIEKHSKVNKPLVVCIGEVDMILQNPHRFLNMLTLLCLREQPTFVVYIGSRFSADTFPQSIIKVATDVYVTRYPEVTVKAGAKNFDNVEKLRYAEA